MNRCHGITKIILRQRASSVMSIKSVDKVFGSIDKCSWIIQASTILRPISCVQVFYHIHRPFSHEGKQKVKRGINVLYLVASIIKDNIWRTKFCD